MHDLAVRWRERGWAQEGPALRARLDAALAAAPSDACLRDLALGAVMGRAAAPGGTALSPQQASAAVERIRFGLAAERPATVFDAAHAAGELELGPAGRALAPDLLAFAQGLKRPGSLRARAYEAYARLADPAEATERLEAARTGDPSWTVRRLAGDAARLLGRTSEPELLHRFTALVRCGRLRLEADDDPIGPEGLAELGLRLPAVYLGLLAGPFPGGRIVEVEDDAKGEERDGSSVFLEPPAKLDVPAAHPADLRGFDEYVYARYIEGARRYPAVDELYALKRYADHYGRGRVDADAYNYGVLLYERAFADAAERTERLLRCRDVLLAYKDLVKGEEWDPVDDRLADAEDAIARERLAWPPAAAPRAPLRVGTLGGLAAVLLDLESPGVFVHDPDEDPAPWLAAPSVGAFLNDPVVRRPGALADADPLALLAEVEAHVAAGRKKEAGRLFADVLERHHRAPGVPQRAAALVERADVGALAGAQLLAGAILPGDKETLAAVRAVLQALPPARAQALVEAVAPYDEDGSPIALFVDAAAGLRKRTHEAVKEAAKQVRANRERAHVRTLRNPWYR